MLSGPDNHSQDLNDEDITGANEPDEQIDNKLLSGSLSNAHPLHKPNIGEQRSGDPECQHPAQRNPSSTSRGLLQHL